MPCPSATRSARLRRLGRRLRLLPAQHTGLAVATRQGSGRASAPCPRSRPNCAANAAAIGAPAWRRSPVRSPNQGHQIPMLHALHAIGEPCTQFRGETGVSERAYTLGMLPRVRSRIRAETPGGLQPSALSRCSRWEERHHVVSADLGNRFRNGRSAELAARTRIPSESQRGSGRYRQGAKCWRAREDSNL